MSDIRNGIKGLFFRDQLLGARGLGAFGSAALSDGILNGCEVTISGSTVTIAPGHIIIGGRVIRIANTITVGSVGSAFTGITAEVDLTRTASKTIFQQVALRITTGTELADVLTDDTNDVNLSDQIHASWLWVHDATGGFEDTYHIARTRGKQLLWQNLQNGASGVENGFAAQTLIIPGIQDFKTLEITMRMAVGTNSLDANSTHTINIPDEIFLSTDTTSGSPFNGKKYINWWIDHMLLSGGYRQLFERGVKVYPTENALVFTTGFRRWSSSGDTYESANYMIPVEIYGVR